MSGIERTKHRYLGLSLLFGSAFGVRFTLDIWTYSRLGGTTSAKFVLVATGLLGMLIGDLGAGQIASRWGYRKAIGLAATTLFLWCATSTAAILLGMGELMFGSAIFFGLTLGAYHSCVDAWFDCKHRRQFGKPADDSDLSLGYWLYNAGYLAGATVSFPLFIRRPLLYRVDRVTLDDLSIAPYILVFAMALLLYFLRPDDSLPTLTENRKVLRGFMPVIRSGRGPFAIAVIVGAAVSVLIQYIDHFAPSLIAHSTTFSLAVELAVLNGIICIGMGLSTWFVSRSEGPLSQRRRSVAIVCGLSVAITAITYILATHASGGVSVAILLGVVQAVLVSLPPLLKAQVLQSISYSADSAIGLSILGASKRLAAIPVAFIAVVLERNTTGAASTVMDSARTLYFILLAIAILAAIGTAAWGITRPSEVDVTLAS